MSVTGIVNIITMLAILMCGAAVIREREHGTMDHLLTLPLSPVEIASAKVLANGFVILVATAFSLYFVVRGLLAVPIAGSIPLFLCGVALYLFYALAVGLFLATLVRSIPQFGLLFVLVFLPMQMLSDVLRAVPAAFPAKFRARGRMRRLWSCAGRGCGAKVRRRTPA